MVDGRSAGFYLLHLTAVVGAILVGFSWQGLLLAVASYYFRMFFITAGYHRYFSHRAYRTSRWFQFVLAFFGATAAQKGALWWAAHHRGHHKYSDQPQDPHSPRQHGVLYAHVGWIVGKDNVSLRAERIPDLMKYPELVWLDKHYFFAPTVYALALYAAGGWPALIWGFFVSTVLLYHGTFAINSACHIFGRSRFETDDDSKNHLGLALLTMGEGWHNNHHYYQSTASQGFYWWEIDLSYYILRGLAALRIVRDLRLPPQRVLDAGRALDAARKHPVVGEVANPSDEKAPAA